MEEKQSDNGEKQSVECTLPCYGKSWVAKYKFEKMKILETKNDFIDKDK